MVPTSGLLQMKLLFKKMGQIMIFKYNWSLYWVACPKGNTCWLKMQSIVICRRPGTEVVMKLPVGLNWNVTKDGSNVLSSSCSIETATASRPLLSAAAQQPQIASKEKKKSGGSPLEVTVCALEAHQIGQPGARLFCHCNRYALKQIDMLRL